MDMKHIKDKEIQEKKTCIGTIDHSLRYSTVRYQISFTGNSGSIKSGSIPIEKLWKQSKMKLNEINKCIYNVSDERKLICWGAFLSER